FKIFILGNLGASGPCFISVQSRVRSGHPTRWGVGGPDGPDCRCGGRHRYCRERPSLSPIRRERTRGPDRDWPASADKGAAVNRFVWAAALCGLICLSGGSARAEIGGRTPGGGRGAWEPARPAEATGDVAWTLAATGLAMLLLPGLALYYGGLVRRKNVLGAMVQVMAAPALVGL